jgi:RND family efflux transporter MFP subunit
MTPFRILSLVAVVGALGACDADKPAHEVSRDRPVLVARVHYEPRERAEALPGVLKARVESDLSFRVGGRIARRLVDVGALVKTGDALAKLDESDLRLQLEAAEADEGAASAALTQAEAEERRVTSLNHQGWASGSDYDRIKSTADQARRAEDKAARAVALARNALDYATLTSDADGVVSAVTAEPGQVVASGATIFKLAHTDEVEAAVAIPENWVFRARTATPRVEYWALPGVTTGATLRELSPNADPATRTYAARFSIPEPPPGARLGLSVTVTLSDGAPSLARVPLGAVFDTGDGPKVWIVDRGAGAVSAAPVVVASSDADSAYLASGAPEGAEVIALGAHKIEAQEKVRIVEKLAGL